MMMRLVDVCVVLLLFVYGCLPVSCQLVGNKFRVVDFSGGWKIRLSDGNVSLFDPTLTVKAGEIIEFILAFNNERHPFGLSTSAPSVGQTENVGLHSDALRGYVKCTAFDSSSWVFNTERDLNPNGPQLPNTIPCLLEWTAPTMEAAQGKRYYYRSALEREVGAEIKVVSELPSSGSDSGATSIAPTTIAPTTDPINSNSTMNSTMPSTASTLSALTGCVVATALALAVLGSLMSC